nr:DUF1778 domain-containing protein [uncultured Brevundimonas sp.]
MKPYGGSALPKRGSGAAESAARRETPIFSYARRIDTVDTKHHIPPMVKTRVAPTESPHRSAAVAARGSTSDAKGSINLRIETGTRQLIDDAAAVLGKTRTEFMVESARRQAVDVLLDQRLFTLDTERYDAFMQALDNPPAPGPKLKALLRRIPAWQK